MSVQLVDRDRYDWKTVRDGGAATPARRLPTTNRPTAGSSSTGSGSTNKLGTSTTHSIFDWLWDSPHRDAPTGAPTHRRTTGGGDGETNTGNTGDGSATNAAIGAPTIGGTPQVGQTLTASTSGINDEDGPRFLQLPVDCRAVRTGGSDIHRQRRARPP